MKSFMIGLVAASFSLSLAFAEPQFNRAPPPVPISQELLQRLSNYLQVGGTHNEGMDLNAALLKEFELEKANNLIDALRAQVKAEQDKNNKPAIGVKDNSSPEQISDTPPSL